MSNTGLALERLKRLGNSKPFMGHGPKKAKIMVVQESPFETEYKRKEYMGGKAGRLLRTALGEVGISVDEIYFTAIVKHVTPEDRLPLPDEVKESEDLFWAEVETIQPQIIIPTGNPSLKVLTGMTGITKHRGQLTESKEGGYKVFPILHPNLVMKQPKYMDNFLRDIVNLDAILTGNTPEGVTSFVKERRYCDTYEDAVDELLRLINLPPGSRLVVDIETVKSNPFLDKVTSSKTVRENYPDSLRPKISAIGFSDRAGFGNAIPLYHRQNTMSGNRIGTLVKLCRQLLERDDLIICAHNGKFELRWLKNWLDIEITKMIYDTMIIHYLAITEEKGTHDLKQLAWLETDMGGYDDALNDLAPKGDDKGNYDLIDWDVLKVYLADDCDVTFRLLERYEPLIEKDEEKRWLWYNLMLPGYYTLANIESDGIHVDKAWLEQLAEAYPKEILRLESRLRDYPDVAEIERVNMDKWNERCAIGKIPKSQRTTEQQFKFEKYKKFDPSKDGIKFNFGSPNQLKELLFNRMGLTTVVLTDKGEPSTNSDSIAYMRKQNPDFLDLLLEYRKAAHLNSNFVEAIQELVDSNSIVHPSYNIHGTVTGRLSSNEPNAQQMPRSVNTPSLFQYNYEIKKMFTSRFKDNGVILQLDYSQLELRILAVMTKDPELIRLYRSGADLHKEVASGAFDVDITEVTKDQRTASKKIQFGIVYQESAQGLSEDLRAEGIEMSVEECERFIATYFRRFPQVERWVKEIKRFAKRNKYVKTMTNRIRHLETIDSSERSIANEALRQAVNAPIQSTGSDCTLQALIQLDKWLRETGKLSRICITVHDSIVLDCPKDEVIEVAKKAKHIMENLAEYNEFYKFLGDVPIVSEMEIGYNYADAFEVTVEDLEEHGVDGFICQKLGEKHDKDLKFFEEMIDRGELIPEYARIYWESIA